MKLIIPIYPREDISVLSSLKTLATSVIPNVQVNIQHKTGVFGYPDNSLELIGDIKSLLPFIIENIKQSSHYFMRYSISYFHGGSTTTLYGDTNSVSIVCNDALILTTPTSNENLFIYYLIQKTVNRKYNYVSYIENYTISEIELILKKLRSKKL